MTLGGLFFMNAAALILVGLFGILTRKNVVRILLSINILQTGVNLLLVAFGWREGGVAPIFTRGTSSVTVFVDPLPQALVLTAIVIAFGTTALGLMIAVNYFRAHKSLDTASFLYGKAQSEEEEVVQ